MIPLFQFQERRSCLPWIPFEVDLNLIDEGFDLEMEGLQRQNPPGTRPGKVVSETSGCGVEKGDVGAGKGRQNNACNGDDSIDPCPAGVLFDARPHKTTQCFSRLGRVHTRGVENVQARGVPKVGAESFVIVDFADQSTVGCVDVALEPAKSPGSCRHWMIITGISFPNGVRISPKSLE